MANRLYTLFLIFPLLFPTLTWAQLTVLTGHGTFICGFPKLDVCPALPEGNVLKVDCTGQCCSIPDYWLRPGVTHVEFSGGCLGDVGDKSFAGGVNVTYINLGNAKLTSMSSNSLCANTPGLKFLDASGNPDFTPSPETFTCLEHVQELIFDTIPCGFKGWMKQKNVNVTGRNTCATEPTDTPVHATTDGVPTSRSSVNPTISSNQPQTGKEDSTESIVDVVTLVLVSILLVVVVSALVVVSWCNRKKIMEMYRKLGRGGHPNQEENAEQGFPMVPQEDNAVVPLGIQTENVKFLPSG